MITYLAHQGEGAGAMALLLLKLLIGMANGAAWPAMACRRIIYRRGMAMSGKGRREIAAL